MMQHVSKSHDWLTIAAYLFILSLIMSHLLFTILMTHTMQHRLTNRLIG